VGRRSQPVREWTYTFDADPQKLSFTTGVEGGAESRFEEALALAVGWEFDAT
jgi:hypothetical protein